MKKQTIYEQINSLARQMIQTNDEEKIKRCQKEICEMVFQHLTNVDVQRKQFSGSISKIRFRLLPEQVFDFEQFNEQLFLSLTKNAKGNWRFHPEKGAEYLTYLRFVISKRVNQFDQSGLFEAPKTKHILSLDEIEENGIEIVGIDSLHNVFEGVAEEDTGEIWEKITNELNIKEADLKKHQIHFTYDMICYIRGGLGRSILKEMSQINITFRRTKEDREAILQGKIMEELSELSWMELLFVTDVLDFFFRERTRTCLDIYKNELGADRALQYNSLNTLMNIYLERLGKKRISLDSMKKWFSNHNDEYLLLIRTVLSWRKK